jgi:D-methionine transport system ATP-binding protein
VGKPALASLLRVENLAYALPYRSILQSLSFEVAAGETVLVTGASGVGKTLLLRLLNRLTEPSRGHVYVADQNCRLMPMPQLRRQVAFVNSEPNLLGMTVQKALSYPLQLQQLSAREVDQCLGNLLEQLPIPESWLPLDESQLSIDQLQLVSLGRSLLLQPRVLLWDEPTKYLDEATLQLVRSIALEQKMALVMTGKKINVNVSRVLYLRAGQLIWDKPDMNWAELWAEIDRTEQAELADW